MAESADAASVDLSEAERRATFDAICRVWDQAVASVYPKQQALRRELADLQKFLDLEVRP